VDGGIPVVDRDLIGALSDAAIPTLVVESAADQLDWLALGAAACLAQPLSRDGLRHALERHTSPVAELADELADRPDAAPTTQAQGHLLAVTGSAGSGRSTVAGALAQHLADHHQRGEVLLLDLARRAHQALLHDAGELVPGIQELVEACRSTALSAQDLRSFTFDIEHRGYELVVGLRRPRDWVTIRARAFDTALESTCRGFTYVVADVDDDVEGEAQTGSFDIEDRNLMARAGLSRADLVVVVALPTLTGLIGLVDTLRTLQDFGIPGARLLVVINRGPRSARARAELTRTIADLTQTAERSSLYAGVVYIPERRSVDLLHRDQARFPATMTDPPGRAVEALLHRSRRHPVVQPDEPILVAPGTLGSWREER
jgi:MinD-like ATPase involved in chromosome partitioning or flagellar assembly